MSKEPIHKIHDDGSETWHLDGILHREDGPAITFLNGREEWYLHGLRHRADGPSAIGLDGFELWYLHGRRHREDGPAVMYEDYDNNNGWYLDGENISFNKWCDELKISDEKKIEFKLLYG